MKLILSLYCICTLSACQTRNWNIGAAVSTEDENGNRIALDFRDHRAGLTIAHENTELRLEGGFAK